MKGRPHKILTPREDSVIRFPDSGSDLLLYNASEIATLSGPMGPHRGAQMTDLGIIAQGAIYARNGVVVETGESESLQRKYVGARTKIDAGGLLVIPGFVDAHTHVVFAGSRENELEMKLSGSTYEEIAAGGGGLLSTVVKTRGATVEQLIAESSPRLRGMLSEGTTTAEAKSGYALDVDGEMRVLKAIETLSESQPVRLISTFLGAHAIPAEFKGNSDAFIDLIVNDMLPQVAQRTTARFCDVWVEQGYFTVDQARRLLMRAKLLGLTPKLHADELSACGGAQLAAEMEAASADHLIHLTDGGLEALKKAGCLAVLLPAASMSSHLPYADARRIIAAGVPVALGTDLNPGNWVESMQFIISLAIHQMKMTPAEALTAATINAAHAIGMGREVGSLEAGKSADFLILDAPSFRHIGYRFGRNLVELVAKSGDVVLDRRTR